MAPPVSVEQWNFRGGFNYWREAHAYTGGAGNWIDEGCVKPSQCNPVSAWVSEGVIDTTEEEGLMFCNGEWITTDTNGATGMTSLLGLGALALVAVALL